MKLRAEEPIRPAVLTDVFTAGAARIDVCREAVGRAIAQLSAACSEYEADLVALQVTGPALRELVRWFYFFEPEPLSVSDLQRLFGLGYTQIRDMAGRADVACSNCGRVFNIGNRMDAVSLREYGEHPYGEPKCRKRSRKNLQTLEALAGQNGQNGQSGNVIGTI